jgi:hypothetical protein
MRHVLEIIVLLAEHPFQQPAAERPTADQQDSRKID